MSWDRFGFVATDCRPPSKSRWCRRVAGPGVGKGRQIAALIFENICRGRTKARSLPLHPLSYIPTF